MEQNTAFLEVFGKSNSTIKVLDFLISFQKFDYTLPEISTRSGVPYSTLRELWDKLENNSIVIKTRKVGNSELYKLNTENNIVKELIKLDWKLLSS